MSDLKSLSQKLGVTWRDESLLVQALTHSSAVVAGRAHMNYDRLEFLGDRVLGVVISEMLFKAFPEVAEGELSRRLSSLVRHETCAQVAAQLGLNAYIKVGQGARPSQTRNNANIHADVMEAILGAIYLDQGFDVVHGVISRLWAEYIHTPPQALKDPKSALQEWAQKRGLPAPVYEIIEQKGPDHKPHFVVKVLVPPLPECRGEGASRRLAEHEAAKGMMAVQSVSD